MNERYAIIALIALLLTVAAPAQKLQIVTTTPDLADVSRQIGGNEVEVVSLTRGDEDLHLVQILPSMLNRLRKADLLIEMGLDMEHAWLPMLVKRSRNRKIRPGTAGFVNCSTVIKPRAARNQGQGVHLHPLGNPHWNVDPLSMKRAAKKIAAALVQARPESRPKFVKNLAAFEKKLDDRMKVWRKKLAPKKGAMFIEYHETWGYFADRFGFTVIGQLEPRPGIPPTAAHLAAMAERGKKANCGLVVGRPAWNSALDKAAKLVGGKALAIQPMSARGEKGGYLAFMDRVVDEFAKALRKPKSDA